MYGLVVQMAKALTMAPLLRMCTPCKLQHSSPFPQRPSILFSQKTTRMATHLLTLLSSFILTQLSTNSNSPNSPSLPS